MGRIAEALKRAQQERARRGSSEPREDAGSVPTSADRPKRTERRAASSSAADVLGRSSILNAPPRPAPLAVSQSPILPEAVAPEVVAFHEPSLPIAEKYRSVRTRLLTGNPDGSARTFAITSSLAREGKTVTTANLGFSLAELRHLRVAMVDLEFRERGLSRLFQVSDKPGIIDVLRHEASLAEVCIPVVRDNLLLIPAGDLGDGSLSELLTGPRAAKVFRELNERFHYTLIDTPPANTVADVGLIAPLCHAVVIVIRMNRTPEPVLRRTVKMLQANHVSITGCILAGYSEKTLDYTDKHDYYDAES